jgi:(1->4)-alpha-D-glucan 1-alpha-D-glucosylmutase
MTAGRRRAPRAAPRATYRLQLHAGFDFDAASAVVPYLAALGVSHLYASPILQAVPGSRHGYDVVDHGRISDDLGGEAGFNRLVTALHAAGMGLVVDLVPNHMAIAGAANRWWWDVLEHGPSSRFADHFDVDWDPPESRLRNVILLPVLEDHYGRLLESGKISLARDGSAVEVRHGAQRFPLDPRSLAEIVGTAAATSGSAELGFIGRALGELPSATSSDPAELTRRRQDTLVLKERLAALVKNASVAAALDASLAAVNADANALDRLLEDQPYRLAYWRASSRDLGYRRFFDINSLIGLRVEREEVFTATHRLILELVAAGKIDGLRIDHPDGLRDPAGYFDRLRAAAPDAWIVVEKILEDGERLPASWPVDGTTGYEFAALTNRLLVDGTASEPLSRHWAGVAPELAEWADVARSARLEAVSVSLGSDLNRLADLFLGICEANRRYRDFTRHDLHEALRELVAALDVYRTYVQPTVDGVSDADRAAIDRAAAAVELARPDIDPELVAFLARILRLEEPGRLETELALRLQQLTPAVMAKGIEDTALYRYLRLTALNEVGSDPSLMGIEVDDFHAAMVRARVDHPLAMLTTSTHDTKRSEDVRARIGRISEIPDQWVATRGRLAGLAAGHWPGEGTPDEPLLELMSQTLLGTWPISEDRLGAYLVKAEREAGLRTSWTAQDAAYETAIADMVRGCLSDPAFTDVVRRAVEPLLRPAREASLVQTTLKLLAPGVPDVYQGTELWDDSLVDPDNRRPVDFARRRALLDELSGEMLPEVALARLDDGLPKLWVVRTALALRARHPEAFGVDGDYRTLPTDGGHRERLVAFSRGGSVLCVVPRLTMSLGPDGWAGTRVELPDGAWDDVFGKETRVGGWVAAEALLGRFPVALLERRS